MAVRELGHPQGDDVDQVLGVIKAFAQRDAAAGAKLRDRWQPGIDAPAVSGRADSGDIEIDLVELLTDIGGLAADVGKGVAVFLDEMQDLGPDDVSALCAACHEISQSGLPLIVVGAGLPHLPAVLSASKSYSERLFAYSRIDRLDLASADRALQSPAQEEDADFTPEALEAMYAATAGYPYFVQAYGKVAWDVAPASPITAEDVRMAAPEAEAEPRGRVLRVAVRAGHAGRAGVPAGDGRRRGGRGPGGGRRHRARAGRGRVGAHLDGRRDPGPQAPVAVAGPGRAAEEGPDLQRGMRAGSRSSAALRPLLAGERLTTSERSERGNSIGSVRL